MDLGGITCEECGLVYAPDHPGAANLRGVAPGARAGRTAIDYAHVYEGALYHGTISDLDGYPQATWTFDDSGGRRSTVNRYVSAEWLARLAAGFERLSRFRATDPDAVADLQRFHVITLATDPRSSDEVARWLETFDVPRVPRPPQAARGVAGWP